MIHETDLRELVEFDGQGHPVLSLYLNVDPRYLTPDQYKLALRSLFHSMDEINPADRKRIEHFVELEYDRQGRGIACFSCQAQGFWRAYTFSVPVDNAIMVDRRPLVRRLVELLDTYGYLGVVAVDRLGARFFSFHLGALEEASGIVGEDVKRHKQGGWAASRFQRHEDEAALGNLRAVAELTERYARQYQWRRLVIAGTDDNVARFLELLPAHIQHLVVGAMPLELTSSVQEVRERAESVVLNAYKDYIERLAANLLVAAAKGGNAVVGLAPTLEAIQAGRVHQLLFTDNYEIPETAVRRCTMCNFLSVGNGERCPVCGGGREPLPDAVNTIARRAISQSAEVIVLPVPNPLTSSDNQIGAYLRY